MPTVAPHPAGMVRPYLCSPAYTRARRAPAPTVAQPLSCTQIRLKPVRSSTTPSVDDRPAKQWPPLRGTTGMPLSRA